MAHPLLTTEEHTRYSRHLLLQQVGESGQRRIKAARLLVVGVGGLGCPAAQYLAAAGVGCLGLVDHDCVTLSNLQRQVLFGANDIGRPKVDVARERLRLLNSHVEIVTHPQGVSKTNAGQILSAYDLILDCTDNFAARYLINDTCLALNKICVHGAVHQCEGHVIVFGVPGGPCYRCLHPAAAPQGLKDCAEAGVFGVAAGMIGTLQAAEALKLLIGLDGPTAGCVLQLDLLTMQTRTLQLARDPDCLTCGTETRRVHTERLPESSVADDDLEVVADELCRLLGNPNPPLLIDIREPHERRLGSIDGSLPIGADDLAARLLPLNPRRSVILYCQVGQRSRWAARMLRDMGLTDAGHLRGGYLAWCDAQITAGVAS